MRCTRRKGTRVYVYSSKNVSVDPAGTPKCFILPGDKPFCTEALELLLGTDHVSHKDIEKYTTRKWMRVALDEDGVWTVFVYAPTERMLPRPFASLQQDRPAQWLMDARRVTKVGVMGARRTLGDFQPASVKRMHDHLRVVGSAVHRAVAAAKNNPVRTAMAAATVGTGLAIATRRVLAGSIQPLAVQEDEEDAVDVAVSVTEPKRLTEHPQIQVWEIQRHSSKAPLSPDSAKIAWKILFFHSKHVRSAHAVL